MSRELKVKVLRTVSTIIGLINVVLLFHTAVVCNYSMEYGFWGWITHPNITRIIMYGMALLIALAFFATNKEKIPVYHVIVLMIVLFLKFKWFNHEVFPDMSFLFWHRPHFLKWATAVYGAIIILGCIGIKVPSISDVYENSARILDEFFENNPRPYKKDIFKSAGIFDSQFIVKQKIKKSDILSTAETAMNKAEGAMGRYIGLLREYGVSIADFGNDETDVLYDQDNDTLDKSLHDKLTKQVGNYRGVMQSLVNPYKGLKYSFEQLEGQYKGYAKGDRGEEYVEMVLSPLSKKYDLLYNIIIDYQDYKGNTSESDLYVLTSKGIICCEIKNKGNEKHMFHITRDGQWSKCYADGKFIEVMDSPFAQNVRHCLATEEFLARYGIDDVKMIPLVIIANEKVHIKNESKTDVIRASELYSYINNLDLPEKYDEQYLKQVKEIFETYSVKEENAFDVEIFDTDGFESCIHRTKELLETISIVRNYENAAINYVMNNEEKVEKRKFDFVSLVKRIVGFMLLVLTCAMGYGSFTGFFTTSFTPIAIALTVIMGIATLILLGTSSKR